MSLMGVDVGTSGCKIAVFSEQGSILAQAYREYNIITPRPGWCELDSNDVWSRIKSAIGEAARKVQNRHADDPIAALSVSSCGEAMTPVSKERKILGNCLLGLDDRGRDYVEPFGAKLSPRRLFEINGNVLGHMYSMPKLQWIRDNQPDLYAKTYKFLLWQDLVCFMLGCEPATDYSLAGRTLLFDLKAGTWSEDLLSAAGIPGSKLPAIVPSGTDLGAISGATADELGLPRGTRAVSGGHDQCCNALGAGTVQTGMAVFGLGTFTCITPAFTKIPDSTLMIANKLGVESHVVPGLYVLFLYNGTGGSLLKWFRDTLAKAEKEEAEAAGEDVYDRLMRETPASPSRLMVLPHFTTTGPPLLEHRTVGVMAGLTLDTGRGEIIKGLIEGATYYLAEGVEMLESIGIRIDEYRPTGGGAKSEMWLQTAADIMGKPFAKPLVVEAGCFGAAILAGTGIGHYGSAAEAARELVRIERYYAPDRERYAQYRDRMRIYRRLFPAMKDVLRDLHDLPGG